MRRPGEVTAATVVAASIVAVAVAFWKLRIIDPATVQFDLLANADFFTQIYPMSYRAAEWLRTGVLPLWNPYQYAGHPFLATQIYGVLYPLNFPYLLFRTEIAIEIVVVLHQCLAGIFTYFYARTIRLNVPSSACAAFVFMLSGFIVGQVAWFPPSIAAAAWLPLVLAAIERTFASGRFVWAAVLGVASALCLLAGWPQTWLYTMYVAAVYTVVRALMGIFRPAERPSVLRAGVLIGIGLLIGLCFAAPQLFPTLELQRLGPRRPGGLSLRQMLVLGPIEPRRLLAEAVDATPGPPRLAYVGLPTLLLASLSLFAAAQRARVFCFWFLATISAALALSVYTPLFDFYLLLPGAKWFRAPQRLLFIYSFAAAMLAAIGFSQLAALAGRSRTFQVMALLVAASLAALLWLFTPVTYWSRIYLAVALSAIAAALWLPRLWLRRAALCALFLATVVSLFHGTKNLYRHPYHDPTVFDRERAVFDFIRQHQQLDRTYLHFRFETPPMMAKQGTLREIYSIGDYEPLSTSRFAEFFRRMTPPSLQIPEHLTFTGWLEPDPHMREVRLLDLLSVRYFVTSRIAFVHYQGLVQRGWRLAFEAGSGGHIVFENPAPLPRAYLAHRAVAAESEEHALAVLTSEQFDPWREVVIEGPLEESLGETTRQITPARITRYSPTSVTIEANSPAAGYLVLTDSYYPGWRARVNGRDTTMVRANYLFRGIPIPQGRHTVTFSYEPLSFRLGLAALLAAVVLTGTGILYDRRIAKGTTVSWPRKASFIQ